jgi:GTPase SAR1 family protein
VDDVLHSRKATKEIIEYKLKVYAVNFRFIDVGGQMTPRQKWFHYFDDVTVVLFVVASSEFDQKLLEGQQTNRLSESCSIFETIVNNDCFRRVAIILFFNKSDLLAEKVKCKSIMEYFPSFQGNPHKLEDVQYFLADMFSTVRANQNSDFYHHFTTATNTKNIQLVFQAVHDSILIRHIQDLMLS